MDMEGDTNRGSRGFGGSEFAKACIYGELNIGREEN